MFNKILVPIDGSESAKLALDKAIQLGKHNQSEIYVLSVAPEALMKISANLSTIDKDLNKDVYNMITEILADASKVLKDYEYNSSCVYRVGDAANEIVSYSKDIQADLIVMGHRGMGFVSRALLGSVSNKVINSSPVSVLVVKHKVESDD